MLSEIPSNLDQSEILSSGNGLRISLEYVPENANVVNSIDSRCLAQTR